MQNDNYRVGDLALQLGTISELTVEVQLRGAWRDSLYKCSFLRLCDCTIHSDISLNETDTFDPVPHLKDFFRQHSSSSFAEIHTLTLSVADFQRNESLSANLHQTLEDMPAALGSLNILNVHGHVFRSLFLRFNQECPDIGVTRWAPNAHYSIYNTSLQDISGAQ